MSDENIVYSCVSCGAPLKYDINRLVLYCDHCKSDYPEIDIKNLGTWLDTDLDDKDAGNEEFEGVQEYECPSCGAGIIASNKCLSTTCSFCGSSLILRGNVSGKYRPDYIVPFVITPDEAVELAKNAIKDNPFPVNSVLKHLTIDTLQPVYVPYWCFMGDVTCSLKGTAEKQRKSDPGDVNAYADHITSVNMEYTYKFNNALAPASTSAKKRCVAAVEPFEVGVAKPFKAGYLVGMCADKYDIDKDVALNLLKKKTSEFAAIQKHDVYQHGVINFGSSSTTLDTEVDIHSGDYCLVPIYYAYYTYKGKPYRCIVNGQTGKAVASTPVSTFKMVKFWTVPVLGLIFFFLGFMLPLVSIISFFVMFFSLPMRCMEWQSLMKRRPVDPFQYAADVDFQKVEYEYLGRKDYL